MADSELNETGNTGNAGAPVPENQAADDAGQEVAFQEGIDFILDIPLQVTVELGRTSMLINDMLKLGQGSVIELHKTTGETLEIMANQKLIARGEVVSVNDNYGIRLTEIVSPMERIKKLK